jgi:hypothetical protein
MKTTGICLCLLSLAIQASPAEAQFTKFSGEWKNANPKADGITRLQITCSDTGSKVHAWARCHPTDCDWKEVDAFVYGKGVESKLSKDASAMVAEFKTPFSATLLTIKPQPDGKLFVEAFDRLTDNSKRSNFYSTQTFIHGK